MQTRWCLRVVTLKVMHRQEEIAGCNNSSWDVNYSVLLPITQSQEFCFQADEKMTTMGQNGANTPNENLIFYIYSRMIY